MTERERSDSSGPPTDQSTAGDEPDDPTADGTAVRPMGWWERLEDDARATADEYEQRGWDTLLLHTADVTPLCGDRVGLSVLVPDDEFETLRARLSPGDVESEVYRTTALGYVALLVVLEDADEEFAVVFPAYYATDDDSAERLFELALDEGEIDVFLRTLATDRVTVNISEPDLLAPTGRA
ncbi:MAG: hypothetical protein V5A28_10175 [Haloarculaceae archaeon]